MRILLTGGSGRLGTELRKLRAFDYVPTRQEMDITSFLSVHRYLTPIKDKVDLIVHAAAYTNTSKADQEREACWQTNVEGTRNLIAHRIPMVYISTEYVFDGKVGLYSEQDFPNPINYYALTKLIGEQQTRPWGTILRCIFKPSPWPFDVAYDDQWTSGDYVDAIAKEINLAIDWFADLPKILHIGTGRKTMLDLARQTRPEVRPNSIAHAPIPVPRDCSLDLSAWTQLKIRKGYAT
jgi:dTDP-4-dehydrorhamnose reductase